MAIFPSFNIIERRFLADISFLLVYFICIFYIQYTLANPNRVVSIKKKSVPISEFVRISEVIWGILQ